LSTPIINEQVNVDYERARRKAWLNELTAIFTRRRNELLSFDKVSKLVGTSNQTYRGMQIVPIEKVVGSVDRYEDFDREFLPAQTSTRTRWTSIDRAYYEDVTLPPVTLYKVGDVYFVKDGNHRVSVAHQKGVHFIDAEVIEVRSRVPLTKDTDPRELLLLAEYGRFLEQTNLDALRPQQHIIFTALGRYDVLLEHISVHRYFFGLDHEGQALTWEQAVQSWYDTLYMPVVRTIRENDILADFPHRTEADLYLWVMDHRYSLAVEEGLQISPEEATRDYDERYGRTREGLRALLSLPATMVRGVGHVFEITGRMIGRALSASAATAEGPSLPLMVTPDQFDQALERGRTAMHANWLAASAGATPFMRRSDSEESQADY
jgi:hypothetical protein